MTLISHPRRSHVISESHSHVTFSAPYLFSHNFLVFMLKACIMSIIRFHVLKDCILSWDPFFTSSRPQIKDCSLSGLFSRNVFVLCVQKLSGLRFHIIHLTKKTVASCLNLVLTKYFQPCPWFHALFSQNSCADRFQPFLWL